MGLLLAFPYQLVNLRIRSLISVEGLETVNKLCTLYLSPKPDTAPFPVTVVKLHKKKCQSYFRVITSPLTTVWSTVTEMSILKRLIQSLQHEKWWILITNRNI